MSKFDEWAGAVLWCVKSPSCDWPPGKVPLLLCFGKKKKGNQFCAIFVKDIMAAIKTFQILTAMSPDMCLLADESFREDNEEFDFGFFVWERAQERGWNWARGEWKRRSEGQLMWDEKRTRKALNFTGRRQLEPPVERTVFSFSNCDSCPHQGCRWPYHPLTRTALCFPGQSGGNCRRCSSNVRSWNKPYSANIWLSHKFCGGNGEASIQGHPQVSMYWSKTCSLAANFANLCYVPFSLHVASHGVICNLAREKSPDLARFFSIRYISRLVIWPCASGWYWHAKSQVIEEVHNESLATGMVTLRRYT